MMCTGLCGQLDNKNCFFALDSGETTSSGIPYLVLDALLKTDAKKLGKVQESTIKKVRNLEHMIYEQIVRDVHLI